MSADQGKRTSPRPTTWITPTVVAVIAVGLLWVVPRSPLAGGFSHDSAYLDRLAQNLLDGRGFINDALWPVFLKPAQLPMPFHNQNPLYSLLIAAVSVGTGIGTTFAGFAVSALAAAALVWGIAALARERFGAGQLAAVGIGVVSILFPPVWDAVLRFIPDMLCAALLLWSVVWMTRSDRWAPVVAGIFLGLAWLTRSTVTLAVPAMGAYLLMAFGVRRGLVRGVALAAAGLLVVSPWLVYTAMVWGEPLRSDAPFTVVSNYHAIYSYGGDRTLYWHAATFPATLADVLRTEPAKWLSYWLQSIPAVVKYVVKGWSAGGQSYTSPVAVAALVVCTLGSWALALRLRGAASREQKSLVVAFLIFVATQVLVFGMLGRGFETRYVCLMSAVVAASLAAWWHRELRDIRLSVGATRVRAIVGVAAGIVLALFALREDLLIFTQARAIEPEKAAYFAFSKQVAGLDQTAAPVVVGFFPYFYSEATGRRALSVPLDDSDLREFMERYHSRYIAFTDRELEYWRPGWQGGAMLPGFLRVAQRFEGATVFERSDGAPDDLR